MIEDDIYLISGNDWMVHPRRNISLWPFIFVVVITLTIYILTLSPSINSFDSAEFTTASFTLGIIHSPGYPLFISLAHLTTLLPFGDPAYKINLLNAVYAALATGFMYLCCWKLTKSLPGSLFCALFLGFTNMFWSLSILTEVYTFDALLISGVLYWLISLDDKPTKQNMYILMFLYGLTLSHHLNAVLFFPWIALLILAHRKKILITWKNIVISGAIFIIPFMAYAYFPIRTLAHPQLDYVRTYFYTDLTTIKGILWMVSGRMFATDMFGRSIPDGLNQFLLLWKNIWLNFLGIGLLFSLYGLWVLVKERKILAIAILGCITSIVLFFSFYNVVDNGEMILPALIFLTIPMARGISNILSGALRISSRYAKFIPVVLSLVLLVEVSSNWTVVDRHQDWTAYNYSHQVMNKMEANAFVVSQWTAATPLEYVQIVEKTRPDVEIFDRGLYVLGLQNILPSNEFRDQIIIQRLVTLIGSQIQIRPVYATENDPLLKDYFCFVPDELVYRIYLPNPNAAECVGKDN
jgi:hypothetical protein